MIKKTILLWIILLSPIYLLAQQKCNCEKTFQWVKKTFENNDAGFKYELGLKGKTAYKLLNDSISKEIKLDSTKKLCAETIRKWLHFFRKGHLAFQILYSAENKEPKDTNAYKNWPTIPISETQLRKQLSSDRNVSLFEGIWMLGTPYKIGIIKKGDSYKGFILESTVSGWRPNQIKLGINPDSSGVYYMGNHTAENFNKVQIITKNRLRINGFYLDRIYNKFQFKNDTLALYNKEMTTRIPFIRELSNNTILLRTPSFRMSQREIIDSLIVANMDLLTSTKNLIIDVRNNGGGSDRSYQKIIPLLYTNPIRVMNVAYLSTPLNNKRMEKFIKNKNGYFSENDIIEMKATLKRLNANLGEFVNPDSGEKVTVVKMDTIYPNPQNVAIIINQNCASTTEQFLLAAQESKKVKIFGTTTFGALDISNLYSVESPNGQYKLTYALTKSYRIPDMAIDGKGIMPDYYIDKSIPHWKWLSFVQNILEQ